ncbi:MAG: hypothetical protein ABIV13_03040, partial [Fimbriimonadales bacterium]
MIILIQAEPASHLFVGEFAYSLGREIPVCERDVAWAAPSKDGKHALLVVTEDGRPALHLWTAASRTCKAIWKGDTQKVAAVYWGAGRALVATGSVNEHNAVIQVTTDGIAKLVAENSWPNFTEGGRHALVTLNKQRVFQIVSQSGTLSKQIAIPSGMYLTYEGDRILAESDGDERAELDIATLEWMRASPRVPLPRVGSARSLPVLQYQSLKIGAAGEEIVPYYVLKGEG